MRLTSRPAVSVLRPPAAIAELELDRVLLHEVLEVAPRGDPREAGTFGQFGRTELPGVSQRRRHQVERLLREPLREDGAARPQLAEHRVDLLLLGLAAALRLHPERGVALELLPEGGERERLHEVLDDAEPDRAAD